MSDLSTLVWTIAVVMLISWAWLSALSWRIDDLKKRIEELEKNKR